MRSRRHRLIFSAIVLCAVALSIPAVHAAPPAAATPKGLSISPVRQFISQDAGTTKKSSVVIGNFTTAPMVVSFSVKAFSVNDYNYNFQFDDPPDNRISILTDSVTLQPNQTKTINYTIDLPGDSRPGGQYYTLFATGRGADGKSRQQIQATSLLYLTVNGNLVRTSHLRAAHISRFNFRQNIPFSLDIDNTGNIHYYTFLTARLSGFLVTDSTSTETHLLLPGKTRHFESYVRAPILPGIYTATYGYSSDYQPSVMRVSHIVYIPPWSIAALVVAVWIVWIMIRRHKIGDGRLRDWTPRQYK